MSKSPNLWKKIDYFYCLLNVDDYIFFNEIQASKYGIFIG